VVGAKSALRTERGLVGDVVHVDGLWVGGVARDVEDARHDLRQQERELELPLGRTPTARVPHAPVTTRVLTTHRAVCRHTTHGTRQ